MAVAGAGVATPAMKPGVARLGSTAQTVAVDAVAQNPPVQVNPATVDDPIHAEPTVGVDHVNVEPLQYSDPDTLPAPIHAAPKVAVPLPGIHMAPVQVKPATLLDPMHAVLAVGVIHAVPSQYRDPETLPEPLHAPPDTAVPPPEQKAPAGAE